MHHDQRKEEDDKGMFIPLHNRDFSTCGMVDRGLELESCGPGLNLGFSRSNIDSASPSGKWR